MVMREMHKNAGKLIQKITELTELERGSSERISPTVRDDISRTIGRDMDTICSALCELRDANIKRSIRDGASSKALAEAYMFGPV